MEARNTIYRYTRRRRRDEKKEKKKTKQDDLDDIYDMTYEARGDQTVSDLFFPLPPSPFGNNSPPLAHDTAPSFKAPKLWPLNYIRFCPSFDVLAGWIQQQQFSAFWMDGLRYYRQTSLVLGALVAQATLSLLCVRERER